MQPESGLLLVILDACRDNPFAQTMRRTGATRTVGARGLGRIDLGTSGVGDTLVAYAAAAGAVAQDGAGRNSPYTAALLAHLEVPGVEVGKMFREVRTAVIEKTGDKQAPAVYGRRSDKDVYLAGRKPEEPEKVEPANPPGAGGVIRVQGEAREAFDAAKDLNTIEAYRTVVDHFPGFYAALARQRIKELEEERPRRRATAWRAVLQLATGVLSTALRSARTGGRSPADRMTTRCGCGRRRAVANCGCSRATGMRSSALRSARTGGRSPADRGMTIRCGCGRRRAVANCGCLRATG